jgi:hypothetical protein
MVKENLKIIDRITRIIIDVVVIAVIISTFLVPVRYPEFTGTTIGKIVKAYNTAVK